MLDKVTFDGSALAQQKLFAMSIFRVILYLFLRVCTSKIGDIFVSGTGDKPSRHRLFNNYKCFQIAIFKLSYAKLV